MTDKDLYVVLDNGGDPQTGGTPVKAFEDEQRAADRAGPWKNLYYVGVDWGTE